MSIIMFWGQTRRIEKIRSSARTDWASNAALIIFPGLFQHFSSTDHFLLELKSNLEGIWRVQNWEVYSSRARDGRTKGKPEFGREHIRSIGVMTKNEETRDSGVRVCP